MDFATALIFWVLIGNVLVFLHYYVYFRSFDNALEHYLTLKNLPEEDKEQMEDVKGHSFLHPISLLIVGTVSGPFALFSLIRDVYRFSIKKK